MERHAFLADIRERLLHAQNSMKLSHDAQHRDVELAVGDCAWLRLHQRSAVAITNNTNASSLLVTMGRSRFWNVLAQWRIG